HPGRGLPGRPGRQRPGPRRRPRPLLGAPGRGRGLPAVFGGPRRPGPRRRRRGGGRRAAAAGAGLVRPADPAGRRRGPPRPAPPAGSSPERLKRELCDLLREVSRLRTVVLFLDDVHWADASTVDLLAYLGTRCAGLRLLALLTYRPTELLLGQHPFVPVQLELQRHGLCREVPLGFLSPPEVESSLALAFPGHHFPPDFAALIHAKTEGNPLFLVDLLHYLRDRGVLAERPGGWELAEAVPDFQRELPDSVRSMIRKKLAQLGE